jgi:hypothetical protein
MARVGTTASREFPSDWALAVDSESGSNASLCRNSAAFPYAGKAVSVHAILTARRFTVECIHTKNGSDEKHPQDNVVCYHIPARGNFPAWASRSVRQHPRQDRVGRRKDAVHEQAGDQPVPPV